MKRIPLSDGKAEAIIDDPDWPLVSQYRWYHVRCGSKVYAQTKEPGTIHCIYLHRLILGLKNGEKGDHRDGNGLDCRRQNLRRCDSAGNCRNRRKLRGTSSRFKGVGWHKDTESWQTRINVHGKQYHLAYCKNEKDAATTTTWPLSFSSGSSLSSMESSARDCQRNLFNL